ncbi:MAG: uracil-DNA glycosylase family protein [Treponema sp.]|jgi:hypothetical protein|nr:uracil-DNA glycosylase family protein [Treponema sp.]
MTEDAWAGFCAARSHYRETLERFSRSFRGLRDLQQRLVDNRSGPAYTVETALVYNQALDEPGPADEIRLILVGDNPGRREQAARRYLVGPSGKIAEGFFRKTAELGVDLRRNVLILNKTPVHTPRTADLGELCRLGGPELGARIAETQRFMASLLLEFHRALSAPGRPVPVWITGYSEMKKGGIFEPYTAALAELYAGPAGEPPQGSPANGFADGSADGPQDPLRDHVFLYRHFSMNQFSADLRRQSLEGESAQSALDRIGRSYRRRILGW